MATTHKIDKPKIYTESDRVLEEVREELANLKSRMNLIEEEQEHNRNLLDQLSFQKDLTKELIASQQEEVEINKENYNVIANVMQDLKSPVSDVVDNLAGIISEIDDQEAQDTLRECINTASNVLNSFSEVEDFCLDIGSSQNISQQIIDIRSFFQNIVAVFQSDPSFNSHHTLRLVVDSSVPEKSPLYSETIKYCIDNLLKELSNTIPSSGFTLAISTEKNEEKFGIEISDLTIRLEADDPTDLIWEDSWVESVQINQNKLLNSGFNLLKTRNFLRKTGGHLEILNHENRIKGFNIFLPLTY
ncbi:MAG: HAMP domain-containing histidine kinase [Proteobacteria bacterium]|nr:HAMP domain-containing histidine kinase [Pseudomonadota bacterium]